MNILFIGNGFDLAHHLPTHYNDFLSIIKTNNGFTFSNAIERAKRGIVYEGEYKELIKKAGNAIKKVEIQKIKALEAILHNNSWSKYYAGCEAEIKGWIDFEKEMIPVFDLLQTVFKESLNANMISTGNMASAIIKVENELQCKKAKLFDRYFSVESQNYFIHVNDEFVKQNYGISKEKILKSLKTELDEFTEAFRKYLRYYVDVIDIKKDSIISSLSADVIISFNYTNTELSYKNFEKSSIYHIHGSIDRPNSLVIGVDEVKNDFDNDFIYFVKYFQRIIKSANKSNSGQNYLELLKCMSNGIPEPLKVTFYGHSLDKTDSDVISPFIERAQEVTIYYYNDDDYERKLINLIKLFDKNMVMDDLDSGRINFLSTS